LTLSRFTRPVRGFDSGWKDAVPPAGFLTLVCTSLAKLDRNLVPDVSVATREDKTLPSHIDALQIIHVKPIRRGCGPVDFPDLAQVPWSRSLPPDGQFIAVK